MAAVQLSTLASVRRREGGREAASDPRKNVQENVSRIRKVELGQNRREEGSADM